MTSLGPPTLGHTFRFLWDSRGSYSVGNEPPTDAPAFDGIPHVVEVRGWSLTEALRNAAELPFADLMGTRVPYEDAVRSLLHAARDLCRDGGPQTAGDHAGGPFHHADDRLRDLLEEVLHDDG